MTKYAVDTILGVCFYDISVVEALVINYKVPKLKLTKCCLCGQVNTNKCSDASKSSVFK